MGLFGGGSSTTVPATGYYSLPSDLKSIYDQFYQGIPNATSTSAFTPPDFNADQNSAFSMVRNAANPTSQSISDLVSAYQNPYNNSVISEINRQSQGPYSLLKQALSDSGGLGSNRQLLGANDIDLSRTNQIGSFLQSQFNNSLNTGLQQQQQNINNLSTIGNQQQQQQQQTQQAPYNALQAESGLLNPVVSYVGQSTPSYTVKTGGGLGSFLQSAGQVANIASTAASLFSDRRLKENIIPMGEENGHKIYEFNYLGNTKKYIGVMADEVPEDAITIDEDGFKMVDYDKLGVEFREAE